MAREKYDIKIDGQGFILANGKAVDGSPYVKDRQQPTQPRMTIGTLGYGDLSSFESIAQSRWDGGFDQFYFADESAFYNATDIQFTKEGKFVLAPKLNYTSDDLTSGNPICSVNYAWTDLTSLPSANVFGMDDGTINKYDGGAVVDVTDNCELEEVQSIEVFQNYIYVSGYDEGLPGTQVWRTGDLHTLGGATWTDISAGEGSDSFCKMAATDTLLFIANGHDGGASSPNIKTYDGTSLTTIEQGGDAANSFTTLQMKALNNVVYFLGYYKNQVGENRSKPLVLRAYDGQVFTTLREWPDGDITHIGELMEVFNNSIYFPVRTRDEQILTLYSFDGQILIEELQIDLTNPPYQTYPSKYGSNIGDIDPRALKVHQNKIYFSVFLDLATDENHVYSKSAGTGWVKTFTDQGLTPSATLFTTLLSDGEDIITNYGSSLYTASAVNYYAEGSLTSSLFDANLFSIKKTFESGIVYHYPLPANTTMELAVDIDSTGTFTTIATNTTAGSSITSGQIPEFFNTVTKTPKGYKIQYKITMKTSDGADSPVIQDVVVRYLLEPDWRWKWILHLTIQDKMILRDGTKEPKNARSLRKSLEALRGSSLTTFTDVDGTHYDLTKVGVSDRGIILEDVKFYKPSYGDKGESEDVETDEYIAQVVLSEG